MLSDRFDRFSDLNVISGHRGEMVPFYLQRMDDAMPKEVNGVPRSMTATFKDHVFVTPSGMFNLPHFEFVRQVVGVDRIHYSVDYLYLTNGGRSPVPAGAADQRRRQGEDRAPERRGACSGCKRGSASVTRSLLSGRRRIDAAIPRLPARGRESARQPSLGAAAQQRGSRAVGDHRGVAGRPSRGDGLGRSSSSPRAGPLTFEPVGAQPTTNSSDTRRTVLPQTSQTSRSADLVLPEAYQPAVDRRNVAEIGDDQIAIDAWFGLKACGALPRLGTETT